MPGLSKINVTFDAGGDDYGKYTHEEFVNANGELQANINPNIAIARLRIDLPCTSTVKKVVFKVRGSIASGYRVTYYTETSNFYVERLLFDARPGVVFTYDNLNYSNLIAVNLNLTSSLSAAYIDNMLIEFEPDDPPHADFTYQAEETFAIQFTNQCQGGTGTYLWKFGDGTQSSHPNPLHIYPALGQYPVTLTFTQDGGQSDTITKLVEVKPLVTYIDFSRNRGPVSCPVGYGSVGGRLSVATTINTGKPLINSGDLNFAPAYAQTNLASSNNDMALGWSHDHAMHLVEDTSANPKTITVDMGQGGIVFFTEDSPGLYHAAPGSNSTVEVDTTEYTMTAPDGTRFILEKYHIDTMTGINKGRLTQRLFPDYPLAPQWNYSYYPSTDTTGLADKLEKVDDGFGRELRFGYFLNTEPDQYKRGKLRFVGDQTATDLNTAAPTGRYVGLTYTDEKENGSAVSTPGAILAGITDTRGKQWQYGYYGQSVGESDSLKRNYLTASHAPDVDAEYSGTEDVPITLSATEYATDTELIVNGDMEDSESWAEIGSGAVSYVQSPNPVHGGSKSLQVIATNIDDGVESNPWNLYGGSIYVVTAWIYIETTAGEVKMQVSDSNAFDQIITAVGSWQQVTLTYKATDYSAPHRLQFVALTANTTFYVDDVSIKSDSLINRVGIVGTGDPLLQSSVNFQPFGQDHTSEMTAGQQTKYLFSSGVMSGVEDNAGTFSGRGIDDDLRPATQSDGNGNGTQLYWSGSGQNLDKVIDGAGNETIFDYNANGTLNFTIDAQGRRTRYEYDEDNSVTLRRVTDVYIDEGAEKALNGDMEADSGWDKIADALARVNELTTLQVFEGSKSRVVLTDSADFGIENADAWTLKNGCTYVVTAMVFPRNGSVKMTLSDMSITAFDRISTGWREWETFRAIYTHSSTNTSVKLQFRSVDAVCEFYVDAVSIKEYGDEDSVIQHQQFVYDNLGRVTYERLLDPLTSATLRETQREYITDSQVDGYGLLKQVTQIDSTQSSNETYTQYTYDAIGRVIKTRNGSTFGDCCDTVTEYDDAGNVVATINVRDISDPDNRVKNPKTTYEYDSIGRRVAVTTNAETTFAQTNLMLFDALGRVNRTITNYTNPIIDQQTGEHQYTPPGTWAWDGSAGVWKDDGGTGISISHGDSNDENIITYTEYNDLGAVRLQQDAEGKVTLFGYDAAGRLTKTIQNALTPGYNNNYSGTLPNASLSMYPTDTASVEGDIVTQQIYDPAGNLVKSIDALGHVNFTVYDPLNRPIKAVRSASDPDYDILADRQLKNYPYSTAVDQDIVTTTAYDALGRVDHTTDMDGRINLTLYDNLGRQYRSIRNYVAQGASPSQWVWRDVSGVFAWRLSSSSDTLVDFGANNDQNVISETIYDAEGRVVSTRDVLGRLSYSVFDGFGRTVKTITNYVAQSTEPDIWTWRAVSGVFAWRISDEVGVDTPIDFGANNDQNVITQTEYDGNGRVLSTRDSLGRQTYNVYDVLGRQVKTVTNFLALLTFPSQWEWRDVGGVFAWRLSDTNDTLVHSDPAKSDENVITETVYDDQGRVQYTRDNRGNVTYNVYTVNGRQRMTIINYLPLTETPDQWIWRDVSGVWAWRQSDTNDALVTHSADNDQNIFTATEETDILGRVLSVRDHVGIETRYSYDALGRRIQTITNYVDGSFNPANPDEDLISLTAYNKAGQVVTTTDVRGTETAFTYDAAGRRLTVTQAANTGLATTSYTCYDKSGRTLRMIQNYTFGGTSPDAKDEMGIWLFDSDTHGINNDRNLITEYIYDALGRQITVIDPLKNERETAYFIDGQVRTITEKGVAVHGTEQDVVTQYRYDRLRRRRTVVQAFLNNAYADPDTWFWDTSAWKDGGNPLKTISHGDAPPANQENNIIVQVAYDIAGRMISRRDPRGNTTTYQYDLLDRRKALTNPLDKTWATAYKLLTDGKTQTELTDPNTVVTTRGFDRLGRPTVITYGDPTTTPDVTFAYDVAGNRQTMSEFGGASFTNKVRETSFTYNATRRMTSVGFDTDGGGTVDETVSYEYEAGGQRSKLTMPGDLNVTYTYNAKGQLVSLTDWDDQRTRFSYDAAGRHTATERANGFTTRYKYDAGGRLRLLRHTQGKRTLGHFAYEVDRRGNRTRALEALAHPQDSTDTEYLYDDPSIIYTGTWTDAAPFKQTTSPSAALRLLVFGSQMTLRIGTGPEHSIFDVYIGKSLWESFDGYAASSGTRDISVQLDGEGPFLFEIRNRRERNSSAAVSANYTLRFEKLTVIDTTYTLQTLSYKYDPVSRVIEADYRVGDNPSATPFRTYEYAYDTAGNRLSETIDSVATTYTYNAANQITNSGFAYDNNGNLTNDGSNIHNWDRANRLLSMGGITYRYEGLGNRISQDNGVEVTQYLIDLQPGLAIVLRQTDGTNTNHYVHSPRGIHAVNDGSTWIYPTQDGLGSVRQEVSVAGVIQASGGYRPFGTPEDIQDSYDFPFRFTGEMLDETGIQYHRQRYLKPGIGIFLSLDRFEGMMDRPMSLNGYNYANGNPVNLADPSGMVAELPRLPLAQLNSSLGRNLPLLLNSGLCMSPEIRGMDEECFYNCALSLCTGLYCTPEWFDNCYNQCLEEKDPGQCKVFVRGRRNATGAVWEDEFPIVVSDPGTKLAQAEYALTQTANCEDIIIAGYSHGADTAIIFAHLTTKPIRGLALLGPTLTGAVGGPEDVSQIWSQTLTDLLKSGTRIYVLNDITNEAMKNEQPPSDLDAMLRNFQITTNPLYFEYDFQPTKNHYDVSDPTSTNNDAALVKYVSSWLSALTIANISTF